MLITWRQVPSYPTSTSGTRTGYLEGAAVPLDTSIRYVFRYTLTCGTRRRCFSLKQELYCEHVTSMSRSTLSCRHVTTTLTDHEGFLHIIHP